MIFVMRDVILIRKIPIPSINRKNSWFWILEDKGDFTVRSYYRKLQGEHEYIEKGFWMKLWSLKLPGKDTNFL